MDTRKNLAKDINPDGYYAQHGIWGAYASFVLGKAGKGGGVAIGDVQPPEESVFIGYRRGHEEPRMLPFIPGKTTGLTSSSYKPDGSNGISSTLSTFSPFPSGQIVRRTTLGGETWQSGLMTFSIASFFGAVPDPGTARKKEFRLAACPSLLFQLTFDNADGNDDVTGYFGLQGIRRALSDSTDGRLSGMARGTSYGFACLPDASISEVMDWNSIDAAFGGTLALRRLAWEGGLRFYVPDHTKKTFTIALGVFDSGTVTAGLPMQRYYTSLFKDLEEVLEYTLENAVALLERAEAMDTLLDSTPLSEDQKYLIAVAAHGYNANTELLLDNTGRPIFLVNEGEYQMMNTLDLTVDQSFWELAFSPWTVKNELDFIADQSRYTDACGIAFCHDQGVADSFTPRGSSSYELAGLLDCFSFMSYEETLNWLLTACLYIHNTGDMAWAKNKKDLLVEVMESLIARDGNDDGIMDKDSDRCEGGAEITTYDSLDISLGQARNNLYLAVKAWGGFVSVGALFARMGADDPAEKARKVASAVSETVSSYYLSREGFIPAVFESGNRSRIIPAIEGLVYPFLTGDPRAVTDDGPNARFIGLLKKHLQTVLVPGVCLDSVSGGWKLSSTSRNTWLSKIFLNQFIAEHILHMPGELVRRDDAHVRWLLTGSASSGVTDQVDASDGKDLGSRFYPRLVTSVLWLLPYTDFPALALPEERRT